jgi:hypothetical protein
LHPARRFRPALTVVFVAVGLAACAHDGTGPRVVHVVVSPADTTLLGVGATLQYAAEARNAAGSTVSGEVASWSTSDSSIATVSPTGLVTATGGGSATITATVAGVAGSASLTVTDLSAPCAQPTMVDLAPGGFASWDASTCLLFDSLSAGMRYRVAVTRPLETATASDTATVRLAVSLLSAGQPAPGPSAARPSVRAPSLPLSDAQISTLRRSVAIAQATERFEAGLRERERTMVERLGTATMLGVPRGGELRTAGPADLPPTLRFDTATTCTAAAGKATTGVLVHQNADMAIYQDSVQNLSEPITEAEATRMTDYYSAYAKGMIAAYFGRNPDIDGNGKLIVLVSPVVSGNEAGFVWVGNFYPTSTCATSNQRDLIFLSAALVRSMDDPSPSWQALETVAHEAKHVVSLYNRLAASRRTGAGILAFEPDWIEEGTAELAGEMSSRIAWAAHGGPAVGATVTVGDFSGGLTPENYGVMIHLARTVSYLASQPNGLVVAPVGADPKSNIYGSGWHFHRWLGDAYGHAATPFADSSLFRALTDSLTPAGASGLQAVTGKTFEELLEEFFVAVCLNGSGAPVPALPFTSYDFPSATLIVASPAQGSYPWPVTAHSEDGSIVSSQTFRSATYVGPIGPSGVRIHDFVARRDGEKAQIRVGMPSPGRVVVVRLQ